MSAFAQGLQAGQRMAEGWIGAYDASRRRREEEELKRRREEIMSAQPEELGLRYTPEQGEQLRLAAESGMYDIDYGDGGYRVSTREARPQTGLVAPEQRVSRFMGQEYEGGLTPQRVQELRDRAMLDTVTDPMERQRLEASQLQMSEARSAIDMRERTRTATQQVAQRLAAGEIIDVPTLFQLAAESGADVNELMQTAGRAYEITDKQAQAVTKKLQSDIRSATTPAQFNELLTKFDPNPDDNVVPELRTAADGTLQVFYGDQPMSPAFRNTSDMSAMAQLKSFYSDQVSDNPMATAIQLATLEKLRAQTGLAVAQSEKARAEAVRERPPVSEFKLVKGTDFDYFEDSRGTPIGRPDPQLGIVPLGADPRNDKRLVTRLDTVGARVVSGRTEGGRPMWAYASATGEIFDNPDEAIKASRPIADTPTREGITTRERRTRGQRRQGPSEQEVALARQFDSLPATRSMQARIDAALQAGRGAEVSRMAAELRQMREQYIAQGLEQR